MKKILLSTVCLAALLLNAKAQTNSPSGMNAESCNAGKSTFTYYSYAKNYTNYGLQFNSVAPFTLTSVVVYPYAPNNGTVGTVKISLRNSSGALLQSTALISVLGYPQSTATHTPQTVTLNFTVPVGTGYQLTLDSVTGVYGLCYEFSTNSYPFPYSCGGDVIITDALVAGTPFPYYYYYFYNWTITSGNGINELNNEGIVSFYPNPLTSSSILQLNSQVKNAEVVIYNMLGKEMLRKTITGNTMQIEKGSLQSGVYFVNVRSEERQWVEKVVVE
jgi:hypothetical protein